MVVGVEIGKFVERGRRLELWHQSLETRAATDMG